MALDNENTSDSILTANMFGPRASVHTTTQYTLTQLVFGDNSILNQCHDVDWEVVKKTKQDKGNKLENHNNKKYTYKQGDKVFLKIAWKTKFDQTHF